MFPNRLKELRTESGYSMDKLVELYNKRFYGKMNKSTLSRYENGKQEPSYSTACKLAKLLGTTTDDLFGLDSRGGGWSGRHIPVYKEFPGNESFNECIAIWTTADEETNYYAFTINDDSMNPRFFIGDFAIVHAQNYVDTGDVVALSTDRENVMIRKVNKFNGGMNFIPYNPTFDVLTFTDEELFYYNDDGFVAKSFSALDIKELEEYEKVLKAIDEEAVRKRFEETKNKVCIIGKVVELRAKF